MRPVTNELNVTGNLPDYEEDVEMTLDPKALKKLIHALTKIYPNETLAVVREYSTNAYDAHIVAGVTNPIKVFLPSALNPTFVVQDEGVGMSTDEISTGYIVYGASSKEEDDEQFGTYGLGSKAALNICDSFSLVSTKNGIKTTALIYKGSNGIGRRRIISVEHTDAPNGTTVTIPVTEFEPFQDAADRIFATWPKGSVLVDGQPPKYIEDDPEYIKVDDLGFIKPTSTPAYVSTTSTTHHLKVVLGGISYRVGALSRGQMEHLFSKFKRNIRETEILLNFTDLTALPILPSREEIVINEDSLSIIRERLKPLVRKGIEKVKEDINTAPDIISALKMYSEKKAFIGFSEMVWKDRQVPSRVNEQGLRRWDFDNQGRKNKRQSYTNDLEIATDSKLLIVDTYGATISDNTILNHLKVWSSVKRVTLRKVALAPLIDGELRNKYAQEMVRSGNFKIVNASEVITTSREHAKASRGNNRSSSSEPTTRVLIEYSTFRMENSEIEHSSLTTDQMISMGKPIYYFQRERYGHGMFTESFAPMSRAGSTTRKKLKRTFNYLGEDALLVFVSHTRKASALLKRLEGQATVAEGGTVLRERIFSAAASNTSKPAEVLASALIRKVSNERFGVLASKNVKSPLIRKAAELASKKGWSSSLDEIAGDALLLLNIRENDFTGTLKTMRQVRATPKPADVVAAKFFHHYPMLQFALKHNPTPIDSRLKKDIIDYTNMVIERDGEFKL